jgi:hypothetical protein
LVHCQTDQHSALTRAAWSEKGLELRALEPALWAAQKDHRLAVLALAAWQKLRAQGLEWRALGADWRQVARV